MKQMIVGVFNLNSTWYRGSGHVDSVSEDFSEIHILLQNFIYSNGSIQKDGKFNLKNLSQISSWTLSYIHRIQIEFQDEKSSWNLISSICYLLLRYLLMNYATIWNYHMISCWNSTWNRGRGKMKLTSGV